MKLRAASAISLAVMVSGPAIASSVKDGVDAWQRGAFAVAVGIWRPLSDAGDPDAAFDLAQAYKLGRGVSQDLTKARDLYGQAAKAGHPQGAADYGLLLFHEGKRATAMPWIVQASEAGDPRAQYVYATALYNGDYVRRDWPMAYALMSRAADVGLPQATTNLALIDRSLTPEQREAGMAIAARLASQPLPPISRRLIADFPRRNDASVLAAAPPPPLPSSLIAQTPRKSLAEIHSSPSGRWLVQLGAYASRVIAQGMWATIRIKAPVLRALPPSYEKAGSFIRLRLGPLADHRTAERVCAAARSAGTDCFAIVRG